MNCDSILKGYLDKHIPPRPYWYTSRTDSTPDKACAVMQIDWVHGHGSNMKMGCGFGSLGFKYGQEPSQEGSVGKGFQFSNDNEMLKIF